MHFKLLFALLAITAFFNGCIASNRTLHIKENSLDNELASIMQDGNIRFSDNEREIIDSLLKHSPSFAQSNLQKAQEKNIVNLPNNMPLYRQPLFAKMFIFPFISNNGVYHGYSESWLKIKEGEFILSDPKTDTSKERMFDYNEVGKQ